MGTPTRLLRATIDHLPKGRMLPEDVWRVRHRTLSALLCAHVPLIFAFGVIRGKGVQHSATEAGAILAFALLAAGKALPRSLRSAMTALGLVASSGVLVHQAGGNIEMHFHFFVMVAILTLYQDWLPFLLAVAFVVVHHAVIGVLLPHDVYDHQSAFDHPFRWALIHGLFLLSASAANVVSWRFNEEQALKDWLTRLPNRRLFQERVGLALGRAERLDSAAVLFIDLDGFKIVNDTLGHAAGDELLVMVAQRLRAALRPGDTAARLGGDEFAVLVEDVSGVADAAAIAERLLHALAVPFAVGERELTLGASVGIAMNRRGECVEEVLRNADVAMYAAKRAGRGAFRVFEDHMHREVVDRIEREGELECALERGEFVLFYQPVVSLETGVVHGFEALVRWQHPTRGLLGPYEFLPLAEETGAIAAIGAWVLETACGQAQAWKREHPETPFTMSVNVSPSQVGEDGFVESVAVALGRSGLAAANLILELTEDVIIPNSPATLDRLWALKALGVQLAVDDFGTGYSSLGYLRRFPFDILKIDKVFIDEVAEGNEQSAFTRAILSLAMSLELQTVAEGVEQASQERCLRSLGCELAQGYHFGRPLPPGEAEGAFATEQRVAS